MTILALGVFFVAFLMLVQWGAQSLPRAIVFVVILPIFLMAAALGVMLAKAYDDAQPQPRHISTRAKQL